MVRPQTLLEVGTSEMRTDHPSRMQIASALPLDDGSSSSGVSIASRGSVVRPIGGGGAGVGERPIEIRAPLGPDLGRIPAAARSASVT